MWYFVLLSWLATVIQVCFITLALAAGLYYLAELVEEYTVISGRIIKWLHIFVAAIYVGLILFEDVYYSVTVLGLVSIAIYSLMLKDFPFIELSSPVFILSCVLVFVNHYYAFRYFSTVWHPFSEVLAFFTICLWMVPFAFFVSLSANDNVLPTVQKSGEKKDDVVSSYFNKKAKRSSLLSMFDYFKESVLPTHSNKRFWGYFLTEVWKMSWNSNNATTCYIRRKHAPGFLKVLVGCWIEWRLFHWFALLADGLGGVTFHIKSAKQERGLKYLQGITLQEVWNRKVFWFLQGKTWVTLIFKGKRVCIWLPEKSPFEESVVWDCKTMYLKTM